MSRGGMRTLLCGLLIAATGCIVNIPSDLNLFGSAGQPFVAQGTAAVIENGGPCPIWVGDNGVTYHLFQDPTLDNEVFDRITAPGTTSRLEIRVRDDLVVSCQIGTTVVVLDVLEIQ